MARVRFSGDATLDTMIFCFAAVFIVLSELESRVIISSNVVQTPKNDCAPGRKVKNFPPPHASLQAEHIPELHQVHITKPINRSVSLLRAM